MSSDHAKSKSQTTAGLPANQDRRTTLGSSRRRTNHGQSWHLVFAMSLIGMVFLVWVMIMAYQVYVNS
ncbi:hypothetical protein E4U41_004645 [Claviceps citrina]|nr:hypothetical protein E4U41_004645 [Claviceps citrina]